MAMMLVLLTIAVMLCPAFAQNAKCIDGMVVSSAKAGEIQEDDGSLEKAYAECFPEPDEAELERLRAAWPTSVDVAVAEVVRWLDPGSREEIRLMARDDLTGLDMGLGMAIRNEFGLWGGNDALSRAACAKASCHPDDVSMTIIEAVWTHLRQVGELKAAPSSSSADVSATSVIGRP